MNSWFSPSLSFKDQGELIFFWFPGKAGAVR